MSELSGRAKESAARVVAGKHCLVVPLLLLEPVVRPSTRCRARHSRDAAATDAKRGKGPSSEVCATPAPSAPLVDVRANDPDRRCLVAERAVAELALAAFAPALHRTV